MPVLPWSLVAVRLLLGPVVVVAAYAGVAGPWLAAMVFAALVSDVYDGVLARRWRCDTPAIRLADSMVDTAFYLGVLWALCVRAPAVVTRCWPLLAALLAMELVRHAYDLRKFGKAASYHSYLAKTWGLVMAVAVMAVLATGGGRGPLLAASVVLGLACDAEGLAMSVILPAWRNDVKTIGRAVALRRDSAAAARAA